MGNKIKKKFDSNADNVKGLGDTKGRKTVSMFTLGCPRVKVNMIATSH